MPYAKMLCQVALTESWTRPGWALLGQHETDSLPRKTQEAYLTDSTADFSAASSLPRRCKCSHNKGVLLASLVEKLSLRPGAGKHATPPVDERTKAKQH